MTPLTPAQLQILAPNARSSYRTAFESADVTLASYAINIAPRRLAHFMAQILHESGGLTVLWENLNYRAARLRQVWPSRFPTLASAEPFAHNPEALANKVYGGRMGNTAPGEGWRYRGRGLMQLTGRESYVLASVDLGVDLVGNPDLALDPAWSLHVAGAEWVRRGCNAFADADSLVKVTRAINGGQIGLADRREWLAKTRHAWKT